jgi:hypothetical protein
VNVKLRVPIVMGAKTLFEKAVRFRNSLKWKKSTSGHAEPAAGCNHEESDDNCNQVEVGVVDKK